MNPSSKAFKYTILIAAALAGLATILAPPATAYRGYTRMPNRHSSDPASASIDLVSGPVSLAAAARTTSSTLTIGLGETYGMDWNLTINTTTTLNVQVLQSNSPSGPWTLWADPDASGLDVLNNTTITTAYGGTRFILTPSTYAKLQFLNSGSNPVTLTRISSFVQ